MDDSQLGLTAEEEALLVKKLGPGATHGSPGGASGSGYGRVHKPNNLKQTNIMQAQASVTSAHKERTHRNLNLKIGTLRN